MEKIKTLQDERLAVWHNNSSPTKKGGTTCEHKHVEFFRSSGESSGGTFFCSGCHNPISAEEYPDRVGEELRWMQQLGENDSSVPEDSVNRGVTIDFLVELCSFFNLWKWSTRDVLFKFIVPLTSGLRCRFTDLPLFADTEVVGCASIFVSHCWSAPFGDMVAGVSEGRDGKDRVWLDILAVRQWPTTKNDLNFEVVIAHCPLFISVCPSLSEVVHSDMEVTTLPDKTKAKIPFFRVWCLYETFYAAHFDKQIIVRGGSHQIDPSTSGKHRFVTNTLMLEKMATSIDITAAATTNPADRDMIFEKIEGFPGGVQGMNTKVRTVIFREYQHSDGKFPQILAAKRGDIKELKYIFCAGGDMNIQDTYGSTALIAAARQGQLPCVEFLVSKGADMNIKDNNGDTALTGAVGNGRLACVEFLVSNGADVNTQDNNGWTAMRNSSYVWSGLSCMEQT